MSPRQRVNFLSDLQIKQGRVAGWVGRLLGE